MSLRRSLVSLRRCALVVTAVLVAALVAAGAWALVEQGGAHGLSGHRPKTVYGSKPSSAGRDARPLRRPVAQARPAVHASSPPQGRPVSVSIAVDRAGPAVPSGFLGLSFEVAALPRIATFARTGALARFLGSLGHGSLRFGGVSADAGVAWSADGKVPRWAGVAISRRDLAGLAALVHQTGWSVLFTVNLGHYDPAEAAQEAAAAHALLGARLTGIEIGNEPDRFFRDGLRGASWDFPDYSRQFGAYRSAIAHASPALAIAAPDASSGMPALPWVRMAARLHPALLTDHYYPLTSCGSTPTVSELLSPNLREDESSMLSSLGAIQRSSAIPLRIDETNDISCKGQPGVSNTFASALWAVDYICRAMASGIQGLNFHDLLSRPAAYSPLVESARALHANPEWYALLLAQRLVGARPLQTTVHGAPDLTAEAFRRPGGAVQLVLVNFYPANTSPLLVRVRLPGAFAGGTILRLTAASPYAASHVRLGGSEVTRSGGWSARLPLPGAYDAAGSPELAVAPGSAALLTLDPRAR